MTPNNEFIQRTRPPVKPLRRRARLGPHGLVLPPRLVNPHQREYLPEQLIERVRTFGRRLALSQS